LNPARLPIPPLEHNNRFVKIIIISNKSSKY
jgi:hypothetical protein